MTDAITHTQNHKGWFCRNLKWIITGFIIFVVMIFVVMIFVLVFSIMRFSDAYQTGLATGQKNAALINLIGEPIKPGFIISGSINTTGPNGTASIAIPVSGPKGTGTIYVIGEKELDLWHYSQIVFRSNDKTQTIDLNKK